VLVEQVDDLAALAAEGDRGSFLVQTLFGMRTIKSLALDARQRHMWDVHVAKVEKPPSMEGKRMTAMLAPKAGAT